MAERGLLRKKLEDVLNVWPRELTWLVADYVRACLHEWEERPDLSELCSISKSSVAVFSPSVFPNGSAITNLTSKYSLDSGPSRWAIDIECTSSKLPLGMYVFIGLYKSATPFCGMSFFTKGVTEFTQGDWVELPITPSKHRVYVTVHKKEGTMVFEYWDELCPSIMRCLGTRTFAIDHEIYPRISTTNGSGCTFSWVSA